MAVPLLSASVWKKSVEHIAMHDIESFIWVLAYCVLRKLTRVASTDVIKDRAKSFLRDSFGLLRAEKILYNRAANIPFLFVVQDFISSDEWVNFLEANISNPLYVVLDTFRMKIGQIYARAQTNSRDSSQATQRGGANVSSESALSYESVTEVISSAINSLETNPAV